MGALHAIYRSLFDRRASSRERWLAAEIETNEEWKAQPAQVEAPRGELVDAVKAIIARATGGA